MSSGGRNRSVSAAVMAVVITAVCVGGMLACGSPKAEAAAHINELSFTDDPKRMEQAATSVVMLTVYNRYDEKTGTGTGFAVFDPAVLVTARHVIMNMDYMIAIRDDGTSFRVERAYDADADADVALCELPMDAGLTALTCGEDTLLRGEKTAAIGSQFGLVNLVTMGNFCGYWETKEVTWILFTSPVSGGSSGGPLLNDRGEVIGVVTGTYEKGQNLNVAAKIETVERLYRELQLERGTER